MGWSVRRVLTEPRRAAILFAFDAGSAALIIAAAWVYLPDGGGLSGVRIVLLAPFVLLRNLVLEVAWFRFLLSRADASPSPLRLGVQEARFAATAAVTTVLLGGILALIVTPVGFLADIIGATQGTVNWSMAILAIGVLVVLAPRVLIAMALSVLRNRFAPFADLGESRAIWNRAMGSAIGIVVVLAPLVAVTLAALIALASHGSVGDVGGALDSLYHSVVSGPVSLADVLAASAAVVSATTGWLVARGVAARAALDLQLVAEARLEYPHDAVQGSPASVAP